MLFSGDMTSLKDKIASLSEPISRFNSEMKSMPEKQRQYIKLSKDLKVQHGIYGFLSNKQNELKIALDSKSSDAKIISVAYPPEQPVRPRRILDLMIGLESRSVSKSLV